jgi:hypothetical protein
MAQTSLFQQFTRVCSSDRIEAYRNAGEDDLEALTRYVWNTSLCESLYPSLQNLEIGLRNSINVAIGKSYGNARWFKDSRILIDSTEQQRVADAEAELVRQGKSITTGRIVAELHFGFWTSLLSHKYHTVLWLRPGLMKDAFPCMSKYFRKRSNLAGRFSQIRKLRNRLFHHEPIWNRPTLSDDHTDILEALGWIDPCLQKITSVVDRFPTVHTPAYYSELKSRLSGAPTDSSALKVSA